MPSQQSIIEHIILRGMLLTPMMLVVLLAGCESKSPTEEAKKMEKPQAGAAMDQAASEPKGMKAEEEMKMEAPAEMKTAVLTAPASSSGQEANDEGVIHARRGHWDVAEDHFRKALEADPTLAEAQYNLGLALTKQHNREDARAAFKKAADMAPDNAMITESPLLKEHTSSLM